MSLPASISTERITFTDLRRRLVQLHPDLDEQTLNDTLEGATNFKEALAALIRSALEDECLAKALRDRMADMRARLARHEARAMSKRQVAVENMEAADIRKLTEPDFTASTRIGPPSVVIDNEDELPIDYLLPQPPKPDKRAILEALTRGATVPGAVLSEPKLSLSVRSQ
jgi:hypothetical protein